MDGGMPALNTKKKRHEVLQSYEFARLNQERGGGGGAKSGVGGVGSVPASGGGPWRGGSELGACANGASADGGSDEKAPGC